MVYAPDAPEGIEHRWALFDAVPEIVDEKFEDGRGYAQGAYLMAQEAIEKLLNVANALRRLDSNAAVVLQDINSPSLDTFTTPAPTAPTIELNLPVDISAEDELEDAIHDKLLNDIQEGGPAIPEDVEDSIFQRNLERDELLHADELDSISAEWSKRGFTLPNGMLASNIAWAVINHFNKRKDVSRDIAIKSFELGDANTKFAIEKGLQWIANRLAKWQAKIQAEIARIEALVKKYLGEVDAYKGAAAIYGALSDIEIKRFDGEIRLAIAKADILIKDAEAEMRNYEVLNGQKIEAMKAVAGTAAQMVAGALSSVSAGVHMSASNASSYGYSTNPSY